MKAQIVTSLLLLLLATYATAQKAESGEKEEFSGEESLDVTEIAQDKVEAEEEGQFTEVEELRSSEDDRQGNEKQKLKDRIKALTVRKNHRCRSSRRSKTCKARYDFKIKKLNDKLFTYLTPAEKEDWPRLAKLESIENQIKNKMGQKFKARCRSRCKRRLSKEIKELEKEKLNYLSQGEQNKMVRLAAYKKVINEMKDAKKKKCLAQVKRKVEESMTTQLLSQAEKDALTDDKMKSSIDEELESQWIKLGGGQMGTFCSSEE